MLIQLIFAVDHQMILILYKGNFGSKFLSNYELTNFTEVFERF